MPMSDWEAEEGDRVVHDETGKTGTVVDVEFLTTQLSCGCCYEPASAEVTVMWDGEKEEDWDLAEDLSLIEEENG